LSNSVFFLLNHLQTDPTKIEWQSCINLPTIAWWTPCIYHETCLNWTLNKSPNVGNICKFHRDLHKQNTCLFWTQKLVPRRFVFRKASLYFPYKIIMDGWFNNMSVISLWNTCFSNIYTCSKFKPFIFQPPFTAENRKKTIDKVIFLSELEQICTLLKDRAFKI
jgi:hypothetical protein